MGRCESNFFKSGFIDEKGKGITFDDLLCRINSGGCGVVTAGNMLIEFGGEEIRISRACKGNMRKAKRSLRTKKSMKKV